MESDEHLFITGGAGSGKSYLLKAIIDVLDRKTTYVVAPTGCAALLVRGTTVHSFAGIRQDEDPPEMIMKMVSKNKPALRRWRRCKTLVIDEVSMLSGSLFNLLNHIARKVCDSEEAFGGIRLIMCGDFYQLPPIHEIEGVKDFVFATKLWESLAIEPHVLGGSFRQTNDRFVRALNDVRLAKISEDTDELFMELEESRPELPPDCVKLRPHRATVASINAAKFEELEGEPQTYSAIISGINKAMEEKIVRDFGGDPNLVLKVGARVMLLCNQWMHEGLINGSTGIVRRFKEGGLPYVVFDCGIKRVVDYYDFTIESGDEVLATMTCIPLMLAWAQTIHKSQGQSLLKVDINLTNCFENGQAYVALSRCTSLEGLRILGWNAVKESLRVDKRVSHFYKSLRRAVRSSDE